jgi:hypothetical protein
VIDLVGLAFAGVLVVSGPSGEPLVGPQEKAMVRCRPAPYFIVDKTEQRLRPQRTVLTGTRVPIRRFEPDRRARPCHLMHAPATPSAFGFMKIADE